MAASDGSPAELPRVRSKDVPCACAWRGRAGRRVRTAGIFARRCARHQISSAPLLSLPSELGLLRKATPPGSSKRVRHRPLLLCMGGRSRALGSSAASPCPMCGAHALPPSAARCFPFRFSPDLAGSESGARVKNSSWRTVARCRR